MAPVRRKRRTNSASSWAAVELGAARRYQAALTAGWTADELRSAGLSEPEKKLRVRKRATRRTTQTLPSSEQADQPQHHG